MNTCVALVKRNTKLFFKDKGMFFTSMVTPLILLLLFVTFLGDIYRDSLQAAIPKGIEISNQLIDGMVGGWLFSSLLAVCGVTVAFCSNMLSVQDKVTGARRDLTMSPVKKSVLALSYYISTLLSTLLICGVALFVCFLYLRVKGWYLSSEDIGFICADVILVVMFGTALSSVIHSFLSTQGQISAVSTIVSAAYGFLCGAYMPISSFSGGIQSFIKYLPGTYGASLLHNHLMRGSFEELQNTGVQKEVIKIIRDTFDSNLYLKEKLVTIPQMYMILGGSIVVLLVIYILVQAKSEAKKG